MTYPGKLGFEQLLEDQQLAALVHHVVWQRVRVEDRHRLAELVELKVGHDCTHHHRSQ